MAKRSGTTRSVGSGSASAARTTATPLYDTSHTASPLSAEESERFRRMEALNEDAIARYNKFAKSGGVLKQKASSDANKSRKAMDDIRYNRPAIMKTLRDNGIESAKAIGKTGASTLGYSFQYGASEIRITGQSEASISKIVSDFNRNGASVQSVEYSKGFSGRGDAFIKFKKRI